jgi:hypothetical protein
MRGIEHGWLTKMLSAGAAQTHGPAAEIGTKMYRQLMRVHIRWADGVWALLILLAAVLMACGLALDFSFIVRSPTQAEGRGLIFLGSIAFAASAVWARLTGRPIWVSVLTALPAVVVGGLSMEMPDGLYAHLAALGLIPAALSAMLAELLSPGALRDDFEP